METVTVAQPIDSNALSGQFVSHSMVRDTLVQYDMLAMILCLSVTGQKSSNLLNALSWILV